MNKWTKVLAVGVGLYGGSLVGAATLELDHPHPEHPVMLFVGTVVCLIVFFGVAALIIEPWKEPTR